MAEEFYINRGYYFEPARRSNPESLSLPKIAAGRNTRSAKALWKDHEHVEIRGAVDKIKALEDRGPELYIPKFPKPLKMWPIEMVPLYKVLHAPSPFGTPRHDTRELYATATDLTNAVRNVHDNTSYKSLKTLHHTRRQPFSYSREEGESFDPNKLRWSSSNSVKPSYTPRRLEPLIVGRKRALLDNYKFTSGRRTVNSPAEEVQVKKSVQRERTFLEVYRKDKSSMQDEVVDLDTRALGGKGDFAEDNENGMNIGESSAEDSGTHLSTGSVSPDIKAQLDAYFAEKLREQKANKVVVSEGISGDNLVGSQVNGHGGVNVQAGNPEISGTNNEISEPSFPASEKHTDTPSNLNQSEKHKDSPAKQDQSEKHTDTPANQNQGEKQTDTPEKQDQDEKHTDSPANQDQGEKHADTPANQDQGEKHTDTPAKQDQGEKHTDSPANQDQGEKHTDTPANQDQSEKHTDSPAKQDQEGKSTEDKANEGSAANQNESIIDVDDENKVESDVGVNAENKRENVSATPGTGNDENVNGGETLEGVAVEGSTSVPGENDGSGNQKAAQEDTPGTAEDVESGEQRYEDNSQENSHILKEIEAEKVQNVDDKDRKSDEEVGNDNEREHGVIDNDIDNDFDRDKTIQNESIANERIQSEDITTFNEKAVNAGDHENATKENESETADNEDNPNHTVMNKDTVSGDVGHDTDEHDEKANEITVDDLEYESDFEVENDEAQGDLNVKENTEKNEDVIINENIAENDEKGEVSMESDNTNINRDNENGLKAHSDVNINIGDESDDVRGADSQEVDGCLGEVTEESKDDIVDSESVTKYNVKDEDNNVEKANRELNDGNVEVDAENFQPSENNQPIEDTDQPDEQTNDVDDHQENTDNRVESKAVEGIQTDEEMTTAVTDEKNGDDGQADGQQKEELAFDTQQQDLHHVEADIPSGKGEQSDGNVTRDSHPENNTADDSVSAIKDFAEDNDAEESDNHAIPGESLAN